MDSKWVYMSHSSRQFPDCTLHPHNVDFYLGMRKFSPKEDAKVFKQQFSHIFTVSGWFKTLTNNGFHNDNVTSCMWMSAHEKCPPLEPGIKNISLMQWLGDYSSLTTQLVEPIVNPYGAQHAENLCISTTWSEAGKWCHEKGKTCPLSTGKTVALHPKQVPSLLNWVTAEKSLENNDDMLINDPAVNNTGSNAHPDALPINMMALSYDDELKLSKWY